VFRPRGELIDTRKYEVSALDGPGSDRIAKSFVEDHHYSGTYPAARERVVLHEVATGALVGVAVFSHPSSEAVLKPLPCDRLEGVELGRFVLLDSVAGNGESWFLARALEILRGRGYRVLLSHSDPMPRTSADGAIVFPGHIGEIYQATNAAYAGLASDRLQVLKPDGRIFSERAMTKIRRWERGAQRSVDEFVAIGAAAPSSADLATRDRRRAWMWAAIFATCRRLEHPGNHRYLWAIDRRLRRAVDDVARAGADAPRPYPKHTEAAA
jgi:hypothetical protein